METLNKINKVTLAYLKVSGIYKLYLLIVGFKVPVQNITGTDCICVRVVMALNHN